MRKLRSTTCVSCGLQRGVQSSGFRISNFEFRIFGSGFGNDPRSPEVPGCGRHAKRFQHRRHTTISLECHFSLLPLGKARRARPDVAFRGRVGGGWGRDSSLRGCSGPPGCPPARRRRAALEVGDSDERLRSEETAAENALPRAYARGGRHGHEDGDGSGCVQYPGTWEES